MRLLLSALVLLPLFVAPSDAEAGTLTVSKRGIAPAWVWVDGEEQGKLRNRRPIELQLDSGEHEVWVSLENSGTVTRCYGLVDTTGPGASVEVTDMRGCEGNLIEGFGRGANSAFRGSSVDFSLNDVDAWVQIDGGQMLAMPEMPFLLNLDPGTHTIVLWTDLIDGAVLDQGTVTLQKGQRLPVTCTPGGCMGFDQAPQIIQVFNMDAGSTTTTTTASAPGINVNVNVPGMSMDMTMPMDATTTTTTTTTNGTTTTSGTTQSTSSNQSCCVNEVYYDCPDADAVYQCSGAFMACMMQCGMMDMECPERCMDTHPLDPSRCSRNSSKDATCD